MTSSVIGNASTVDVEEHAECVQHTGSRDWPDRGIKGMERRHGHTEQPGISDGEATVPWKRVFTINSCARKQGLWCTAESWRFCGYRRIKEADLANLTRSSFIGGLLSGCKGGGYGTYFCRHYEHSLLRQRYDGLAFSLNLICVECANSLWGWGFGSWHGWLMSPQYTFTQDFIHFLQTSYIPFFLVCTFRYSVLNSSPRLWTAWRLGNVLSTKVQASPSEMNKHLNTSYVFYVFNE